MGLLSRWVGTPAARDAAAESAAAAKQQKFRGIEVIPDSDACCDAAREMAGQRLLSKDAPRLPLAACTQQQCNCRYVHYTDRRTDYRRDGDIGIGTREMFYKDCRRSRAKGRRGQD